jgi:hypothetical protein
MKSNKIIYESKTQKLNKSYYKRPITTITDSLQTNTAMQEKLKKYIRVENIDDVPLNTHVRYVTIKDGIQRFCLGGFLKKKDDSRYIILSNGKFTWSVQRFHWKSKKQSGEPIFETIFFRIKSQKELYEDTIKKQNEKIKILEKKLQFNS